MKKSVLLGIVLFCLVGISGNVWAESSTKLLLSFDGNDGDTFTTDYSGSAHTITFQGDSQLDTAEKKFGTASLLLDGTNDYINLSDSDDWNFGSGDFTIDFWMRANSMTDDDIVFSQYQDVANTFHLKFVGATANKLQLYVKDSGVERVVISQLHGMSTGTWYHIAVVRSGSDFDVYVDGSSIGSDTYAGALGDMAADFLIGANTQQPEFDGWIDEFRISKGIARWTTTTTTTTSTTTTTTTVPPTTTTTTVPTTTTTIPPTPTPAPTTTPPLVLVKGSIIITSNPAGADVLFNGAPIGQTPITKSNLPVGIDHHIIVSKPGYYRKERIASATTEGTQVYVELNKIPEGRPVPHLTTSQTGIKTLLNVGEETLLQYGIFNDGDADAYDVKISMEIPSGVTASFVSGASKAGGLVTWTGDKIKAGATESATVRIKSEEAGTKFIPLRVSYKDDSGNKYIDDLSLSIEMVPAREAGRDSGRDPDPQDPAPLDPAKPGSGNPLKGGICGPTALLGIALLPLGLWGLLRRRG